MALNHNDLLTAPVTTVYNRLGLPATIGDGTGTRTLEYCAPCGVVRTADLAEEEAELAGKAASLKLTAHDDDDRNHF